MGTELPALGTRVSLRYRLPPGSVPPLTDVFGRLLTDAPMVTVRTKSGALVEVDPSDVLAVRPLTEAPVRTSQIRNLEAAAADAWPGLEQHWCDGWLLRYAGGPSHQANSAVPLEPGAQLTALPAIVDWYRTRDATPWLALPDRLVRLPDDVPTALVSVVLVRELGPGAGSVAFPAQPDDEWLKLHERGVDVAVLTAVRDGELAFGVRAGVATGRAAVTRSPDGTTWVGLSAVHVAASARRGGHARALCAMLLDWGTGRGATRGYVEVLSDNAPAARLYESTGFTTQHRVRYVDARTL